MIDESNKSLPTKNSGLLNMFFNRNKKSDKNKNNIAILNFITDTYKSIGKDINDQLKILYDTKKIFNTLYNCNANKGKVNKGEINKGEVNKGEIN